MNNQEREIRMLKKICKLQDEIISNYQKTIIPLAKENIKLLEEELFKCGGK